MFVPKTFTRGIIVNTTFDLTQALATVRGKQNRLALAALDSYFTLSGEPVRPGVYLVTVRRNLTGLPMFKVEFTENPLDAVA